MPVQSAAITKEEITAANRRRRWLVIGTLFVSMLFVMGGTAVTLPIFLTPLVKQYGWSHARVSTLPTVFLLMLGAFSPLTGWLLDRLDARVVMPAGAALVATGLLCASEAHSYWSMVGAYALIGTGAAGATIVPCALVAANWFADNRGLAIGSMVSGPAAGGMLLPPATDYVIRNFGIGTAFLSLALPIALVVMPLLIFVIRTRPAAVSKSSVSEDVRSLPGLDLGPALRAAPFWLLACVQVMSNVAVAATFYHTVPFFINADYVPEHAALLQAACTAVAVPGNLLLGMLVDRFSARRVLPWALIGLGASPLLLLGSGHGSAWIVFLVAFVTVFGVTAGSTNAVTPVALVESLGLRRFGSISGLIGLAGTIGMCGGAMIVGWVFDLTGSYSMALEFAAASAFVGAVAAFVVSPAEGVEVVPASPSGYPFELS